MKADEFEAVGSDDAAVPVLRGNDCEAQAVTR